MMRFIDLEQLRPEIEHLIPQLEAAKEEVASETDPERRADIIRRNRHCWTAFREAFDRFSHGKCWYVECKNPGTDDDIDHYRPKSGVKEAPDHPGYYWLAFEWTNLRLSCHRANRPRVNVETGDTGGKAEHFPLINPSARAFGPADHLTSEIPALLDPTNPHDPVILSFKPNGEVDLSPDYRGDSVAEAKFDASRIYLHLNWPKFRDDRVLLYNNVRRTIGRGVREAPSDRTGVYTATESFKDIIRDLVNAINVREPYSAAARVYVESFKHDVWWIRDIVLKVAA
jgi:uncharacterized protein (TIGR02646 family)